MTRNLICFILSFFLLNGCNSPDSDYYSPHLPFGNPSNANTNDLNNYLMEKPQYVLSYNCAKGTANWVAWQLNQDWLGSVDRSNDFRPAPDLPENCYRVNPNDYRNSGFDRGHLTPSGDRTKTPQDNSATFVMTNIIPQAPANNRGVWQELEQYSRQLAKQGKTLYLIAGGDGAQSQIGRGNVTVPTHTWKIIVILENPNQQITDNTQIIAVRIPNEQSVSNRNWRDYLVSVDVIETVTGLDFFANVAPAIQNQIESTTD